MKKDSKSLKRRMVPDMIRQLEKEFDIRIPLSPVSKIPYKGENAYSTDREGKIVNLFLEDVPLKRLDTLMPVADSLRVLSLKDCGIKKLSNLTFFSNLEKLSLHGNSLLASAIKNITVLEKLKKLDLSLTDIEDTSPLGTMTGLTDLDLSFNGLEEVKGLEKLRFLKRFKMEFNSIEHIEKISLNENIQSINLRCGDIKQVSGLDKYTGLRELNLGSNPIRTIQGLDRLTQLRSLDLSYSNIEKIEGLDHLVSLKKLDFSDTEIQQVEHLDHLVNLEYVLLQDCRIKEVDTGFLSNLKKPCIISFAGTPIKQLNVPIPDHVDIKFGIDYLGFRKGVV